tara:strand:+ start:361 stop:597 length:237 start_codon:yes stop_codon:yes gene_type:complete
MMYSTSSYLTHLKRSYNCPSCRWIVKYNAKDLIREVKLVYNPDDYSKSNAKRYGHKARKLYNQEQLITILEDDKEKRK